MKPIKRLLTYIRHIEPTKGATGLNIIGRRRLWYTVSMGVLVPCVIALGLFGLRLGIDFKGGAVLEISGSAGRDKALEVAQSSQLSDLSITTSGNNWLLRYHLAGGEGEQANQAQAKFEKQLNQAGFKVVRFDQVGPTVSRDLVKSAFLAISFMSLAILLYITYVFRKVPKGISALSFGLATLVAAFLHDALFVLGSFAILGKFLGVEVDTYIVTAILTVIGFSIHDTVVVFDRIREKVAVTTADFTKTVNDSINETLARSLNTSLVIILVLLALFLFGGSTTRYFILALLLGMVSGTYSSIFVASPLLVTWHNRRINREK
ncbi:protein translocase subunit SecF [Candidatus Microgenomates bacterium]|nr:protein translocase subunit SecF [Candidatus Microgenomates bacterium]